MKKLFVILFSLSLVSAFSMPASSEAQAFGTCLIDSLTGKERKQLAKWVYFAIAAHPEMESFSNVQEGDRKNTDKSIGSLVTRLLVDDCPQELILAQNTDPLAIQKAFELVGQVAMQELMTSQDVVTAISSYANYLDQGKINALFVE